MARAMLTYENKVGGKLKGLVGTTINLIDELENEFIIKHESEYIAVNKENFTAYGKYKGKDSLVVEFKKDNKCRVICDGNIVEVDRNDIEIK